MATRRRASTGRSTSTTTRRTRRRSSTSFASRITPEVVRSIVGITLLVLGAMTLIALILPGEGSLTSWWTGVFAPWFGAMRWLLPFVLLLAGWYLEWRQPKAWGFTLLGLAIAYVGIVGAAEVLGANGGRVGRFLQGALEPLLTTPGAFIVLIAMAVGGVMLAFDVRLAQIVAPLTAFLAWLRTTGASALQRDDAGPGKPVGPGKTAAVKVATNGDVRVSPEPAGGPGTILDQPATRTSVAPVSQTVVTPDAGGALPARRAGGAGAVAVATEEPPTALAALQAIDWTLPEVASLEERPVGRVGPMLDHAANIRRIEEKLLSFAIPAKVVATNSGPVVTQYEVRPEHHVKVSRIEALADDLAMALAARSIRIEAPIPGKDVVGIEIPNDISEVVGFRAIVEERNLPSASSPLTFALGRDVSGEPFAVDLAKMPHLLVAGATGSGKSVCVNALITSILMRARPDEVRMILVDLKRVELAPYDKLPHLLQHVIVEPGEAKAVLNWAVTEMETRYKQLAAHTVRNIGAFNARPDLEDSERMPYIVLIIDELADLIMREGRKVEDPIVKIAQKARAVGIHLVLATQRPSVNVVTGLIKANVPSRIAFAMASMVDSRTVLDSPGAEDLLGRGDMLYQPVDLPHPVRMQGVFVSDNEVSVITRHWLGQTGDRTFYDEEILAFTDTEGDGGETGQFAWLTKLGVDSMTPAAAELVTTSGKASTSFLQTKLKLGFARASRVMDELERYGIISPSDPRNPAAVRQVYGRENWFMSTDDVDADD
jgi:S-DNA-T family DNA segregation ATPase FtsK/SpoIIIE